MNIREIEILNPQETSRGEAFSLWMTSPMPMVTLVKTLDVTKIVKYARRHKLSFNMLLCWCIGRAASQIPEFYMLPNDDSICRYSQREDLMIVGTSAITATELDCIVNQYTDKFFNPMVMWGKYRKRFIRTTLPISFQFHHVQMDGGDGARFLEELQIISRTL